MIEKMPKMIPTSQFECHICIRLPFVKVKDMMAGEVKEYYKNLSHEYAGKPVNKES